MAYRRRRCIKYSNICPQSNSRRFCTHLFRCVSSISDFPISPGFASIPEQCGPLYCRSRKSKIVFDKFRRNWKFRSAEHRARVDFPSLESIILYYFVLNARPRTRPRICYSWRSCVFIWKHKNFSSSGRGIFMGVSPQSTLMLLVVCIVFLACVLNARIPYGIKRRNMWRKRSFAFQQDLCTGIIYTWSTTETANVDISFNSLTYKSSLLDNEFKVSAGSVGFNH